MKTREGPYGKKMLEKSTGLGRGFKGRGGRLMQMTTPSFRFDTDTINNGRIWHGFKCKCNMKPKIFFTKAGLKIFVISNEMFLLQIC